MKKPLKIILLVALISLVFAGGLFQARAEYPENIKRLLEQIIDLKAQIARLQVQLIQLQGKIPSYENVPAGFAFSKDLKSQDYSDDVKHLQTILKKEGFFCQKCQATGYFGYWTETAVKAFQEKYASEILSFTGQIKGSGIVDKATQAKLNSLLVSTAKNPSTPTPSPSPSPSASPSPSPSPTVFNFDLSVSPPSYSASQGTQTITNIYAASNTGHSYPVLFSVTGLPSNATSSFSSTSCYLNCSSVLSISTSASTPAGAYPISIAGTANNLTKSAVFSLTVTAAISAPQATTNEASNVQANQAQLNGNIVSLGGTNQAWAWFEWGPTIAYGNATVWKEITSPASFSETIANLIPGTTYHFRAAIRTTAGGTTYGQKQAFSTLPAPAIDLKANSSDGPITISYNASANLSWASTNVTSCVASGNWSGTKVIQGSENTGALTNSKTYTLTCSSTAGQASDSVTVNVLPQPAPVSPKVYLLIFNPVIESEGNKKLVTLKSWNDPDQLSQQYIQDVKEISANLVNYQISERLEADVISRLKDGYQYTDESYLQCLNNNSTCHTPWEVDYNLILSVYNICEKLNSGLIDELWLFGGPWFGYYESRLAGPGAFWYNSPPLTGTTCNKLLPIMGFNYERGVSEMLEDLGHRTESTMWHVYGSWNNTLSDHAWNIYTHYDKTTPGQARCGNVHYAPNSQSDYDWSNAGYVDSYCGDWYNYPNLIGARQNINCSAWNCDSRSYHKWWLSHLPRASGTSSGKLNNWWKYIADYNNISQ